MCLCIVRFYLCEPALHAGMVIAPLSVAVTRMAVLLRQRTNIDYAIAKNSMEKWKHPLRVGTDCELRLKANYEQTQWIVFIEAIVFMDIDAAKNFEFKVQTIFAPEIRRTSIPNAANR